MNLTIGDLRKELQASREFLNRSSQNLDETDSNFAPVAGQMSASQQLAHIAHTIDWLIEGAFNPEGFDLDFSKHAEEIAGVKSINEAREQIDKAFARLFERLESNPEQVWDEQIASGPVMGGEPRWSALIAVIEHTAHHRGALTVYTRLRNKVPPMPYM